jgi:hypothetical protein
VKPCAAIPHLSQKSPCTKRWLGKRGVIRDRFVQVYSLCPHAASVLVQRCELRIEGSESDGEGHLAVSLPAKWRDVEGPKFVSPFCSAIGEMPAVWTNVDSATDDETVHFQSGEFGLATLRGDPRDLPGIILAALEKNGPAISSMRHSQCRLVSRIDFLQGYTVPGNRCHPVRSAQRAWETTSLASCYRG